MIEKSKSELESELQEKALEYAMSFLKVFANTKKWIKSKKKLRFF